MALLTRQNYYKHAGIFKTIREVCVYVSVLFGAEILTVCPVHALYSGSADEVLKSILPYREIGWWCILR